LYRLITIADTKNDLLFFVSAVRDNRYLKLILGIGCLYQPLLPKIFQSPRDASQKYLCPLARPYLHTARPSSSTRSKISLSLHSSSLAALHCSGTRMEERCHSEDRSAVRQLLHSPLLPHRQQRSSLLLQHRQWQSEARWRMSEQTMALPSSSPSPVTSGGAAACRRGDRGAPLFFPNGISNGAPPFFPNRVLLPPLDCTSSLPPASSRFGPVTASFGATWTRCSLACARRRSSLWVQRSLSAPAASSPTSPSPA
jgi:hypothetical protein